MRTTVVVCALLAWCQGHALAQPVNVIYQRNQNLVDPTNYHIFPTERRVEIYLGIEGETFVFDAAQRDPDTDEYLGLGFINGIVALEDAGPVTVSVLPYDDDVFGAASIGNILLDNITGVTGVLQHIVVRDDLGASGGVFAARLDGTIDLDGVGTLYDVHIGQLNGGTIFAGTLGNVTLGCAAGGPPHTGEIHCGGLYDFATFQVCGSFGGDIHLQKGLGTHGFFTTNSDFPGRLYVGDESPRGGTLDGEVTITGDVTGYVSIGSGYPSGDRPPSVGTLHITGRLTHLSNLAFATPLAGTIRIDGDSDSQEFWTANVRSVTPSGKIIFGRDLSGILRIINDMDGEITTGADSSGDLSG